MSAPFFISLTCDTVSDYFDSNLWSGTGEAPLSWSGVEDGIPSMLEVLSRFVDSKGQRPVSTWFLPVDNHLEERYGDAAYLVGRYRTLWDSLASMGDEIAWHAFQHRTGGAQWEPEQDDSLWSEGLKRCKARLAHQGIAARVTRIGGTYCTNSILRILSDLGIVCDMSALPGRTRATGPLRFDWQPTPETPYHPSTHDYRVPGAPHAGILEIPFTMVFVKAQYDRIPFRRYVDLSFHHDSLWPGLRAFLATSPPYLTTIIHPSTIIDGIIAEEHGLLSFDIGTFYRNLEAVVEFCRRMGRPFLFVTASALAEAFLTGSFES